MSVLNGEVKVLSLWSMDDGSRDWLNGLSQFEWNEKVLKLECDEKSKVILRLDCGIQCELEMDEVERILLEVSYQEIVTGARNYLKEVEDGIMDEK